jgi:hypothetical protein
MFVRFRQTSQRLQASLVETRRIDGKVRHEHIAGLGSVEMPLSVEGRLAFWQRLHERLAKLSNRVDAVMQGKLLGDIHVRIPMVTLDEQRALQLRNAEADEQFWTNIHDMHAGTVEGHKGLATTAERKIAEGEAEMAKAASHRDAAKERRERLQRGEDVPGGLGKPLTREDAERIMREPGNHGTTTGQYAGKMGSRHRQGDAGAEVRGRLMMPARQATSWPPSDRAFRSLR